MNKDKDYIHWAAAGANKIHYKIAYQQAHDDLAVWPCLNRAARSVLVRSIQCGTTRRVAMIAHLANSHVSSPHMRAAAAQILEAVVRGGCGETARTA